VATISNDNLQDLKTGQLVDSTPWKQQLALVIGVVFGAIVIPPVLSLMQGAFGFAGAPEAGDDALAAPQANLIKHLVQGVLGGDLNWSLLGLGALIGAVVIAIDEILRRNSKYSLPPLAVGMGMYLPTAVTVMIPIGAALGHLYDRWAERTTNPERAKRMGTLMATGLIVGESLAGGGYAGIVAAAADSTSTPIISITTAIRPSRSKTERAIAPRRISFAWKQTSSSPSKATSGWSIPPDSSPDVAPSGSERAHSAFRIVALRTNGPRSSITPSSTSAPGSASSWALNTRATKSACSNILPTKTRSVIPRPT